MWCDGFDDEVMMRCHRDGEMNLVKARCNRFSGEKVDTCFTLVTFIFKKIVVVRTVHTTHLVYGIAIVFLKIFSLGL